MAHTGHMRAAKAHAARGPFLRGMRWLHAARSRLRDALETVQKRGRFWGPACAPHFVGADTVEGGGGAGRRSQCACKRVMLLLRLFLSGSAYSVLLLDRVLFLSATAWVMKIF